jgi:NadR type nicotinamide-nucleotide adenylyltransferase
VNDKKIYRVAVIGPESSGKSELTGKLASHYNTIWIPEYARDYLARLKGKYNLQDIIQITRTQYEQEAAQIEKATRFIFTDTEAIISRIWCEYVFGESPEIICNLIRDKPYDLYLLTDYDLPWIADELRENPGKGEYFFNIYKKFLEENNLRHAVVSGKGETRYKNAVLAVENFLMEIQNRF